MTYIDPAIIAVRQMLGVPLKKAKEIVATVRDTDEEAATFFKESEGKIKDLETLDLKDTEFLLVHVKEEENLPDVRLLSRLASHQAGRPVHTIIVPPGLSLETVDEQTMNHLGWIKSEALQQYEEGLESLRAKEGDDG